MNYTVYKHTNKINGKVYIGITSQEPTKRWLNGYGYGDTYFGRAIKKYGWDNFEHEVMYDGLLAEFAKVKEIELIHLYNSTDSKCGYNLTMGGEGVTGFQHSKESRNKMSKSHTGKKLSEDTKKAIALKSKGRNHTESTKSKMSSIRTGIKLSNETKLKISQSKRGKSNSNKGRIATLKTRLILSESHKGKPNPNKGKEFPTLQGGLHPSAKKVVCEDMTFDCIKDCAEYYGIKRQTMNSWLLGKNKTPKEFLDKGLRYLA